jgi:hypothetical protein
MKDPVTKVHDQVDVDARVLLDPASKCTNVKKQLFNGKEPHVPYSYECACACENACVCMWTVRIYDIVTDAD